MKSTLATRIFFDEAKAFDTLNRDNSLIKNLFSGEMTTSVKLHLTNKHQRIHALVLLTAKIKFCSQVHILDVLPFLEHIQDFTSAYSTLEVLLRVLQISHH